MQVKGRLITVQHAVSCVSLCCLVLPMTVLKEQKIKIIGVNFSTSSLPSTQWGVCLGFDEFAMHVQWNLSIKNTLNKGHLSIKDTCSHLTVILYIS